MKPLLEVCLVALVMNVAAFAQNAPTTGDPSVPQLREGISVHIPVTPTAPQIPDADRLDAIVVSVTANTHAFIGTKPVEIAQLAETLRSQIQGKSPVYLKLDSRVSYETFMKVVDAVHTAGVPKIGLLTSRSRSGSVRPVTPRGYVFSISQ
jgi:biopolymer transport protein ExbD